MPSSLTNGRSVGYRNPEGLRAWKQANKPKLVAYAQTYANKNPASYLRSIAKCRARSQGIPFDLTVKDIVVPEFCPALGMRLVINLGKGFRARSDSPSLDRIDNTQGYVPGNVQVISHLANMMKSKATREQLERFAHWVLQS